MRQKILGVLGAIIITLTTCVIVAPVSPVMAAPADACGSGEFLGLKQWHAGLCKDGELVSICEKESGCPANSMRLQSFVWRAVLNVLFDITLVIGYISFAMIVYGGYMFMMSQGDPTKVAKGKKTITAAIIGTVISIGASVIVNTVIKILSIDRTAGWNQNQGGFSNMTALSGILGWAYVAAGIVAVGFIIKSGIDYMISTGDLGKTKKATHGLIYSIVGLLIVILASVITSFVISSAGGAAQ